jgi:hypothetical protein
MLVKILSALLATLALMSGFVSSSAFAADEGEQKSIYCDDGSLCVPDGEPEPECD